jgi:hypothetical protein
VRTFADWRDPPPGFFEIDMVEHCCGPKTDGDYLHSLVLTDIASGWTECVTMRTRNQMLAMGSELAHSALLAFGQSSLRRYFLIFLLPARHKGDTVVREIVTNQAPDHLRRRHVLARTERLKSPFLRRIDQNSQPRCL